MAKIREREMAQQLRRRGVSISDIAKKVNVSKSTVSLWCRDIVLSESAIENIVRVSQSKSTLSIIRYTEKLRLNRQHAVSTDMEVGRRLVGDISDRDILCIGLGLYWGEGYKQGSQEFGFTNSDPNMIRFYIKWLSIVFNVSRNDLILRVSINESHKSRIKDVQDFWSGVTRVSCSQFTKPSFIKSANKKVYKNHDMHYGTLRIKVRRGTSKRRIVLGALDAIKKI